MELPNDEIDFDFDDLIDQLGDVRDSKRSVSEAAGALRQKIKAILDSSGYHAGAFGVIRSIDDMSETKRADFLRTFRPIFQALYDEKWRPAMVDMIEEAEGDFDSIED